MTFWNYFDLPKELIEYDFTETSVKIIIGENGSGKSTLLSNLAKRFSTSDRKVIAIANTIYDKFNFTNNNFFPLKASSGKYLAKKTIINSIKNLAKRDQQTLRSTMMALGYVGFDERLGFKIVGFNSDFEEKIFEAHNISDDDKKTIIAVLFRLQNERKKTNNDLIWISDYKHSFEELYYSDLIQLFSFEYMLRQCRIINRIDVFLSRQKSIIPMLHASSGELSLISSIIYISTVITNNSMIIIDEPENSLHPKWQTEYVERLIDIFYYQKPQIIIATHSPLIISGAELMDNSKIEIFKAEHNTFEIQQSEPQNVEEIYSKYFDLTTPENRYISELVIDKINLLTSKDISFNDFKRLISELHENSYDENQKKVLLEIIELGEEILTDIE
jgi:predicted ATPase